MQRKKSDNNNNNNNNSGKMSKERERERTRRELQERKRLEFFFSSHISMCTGKITEIRRSSVCAKCARVDEILSMSRIEEDKNRTVTN